jgi:hypothetical protein
MIWGCITWYGVSTLCQVNGNINAEKYISVWDSQLWSVIVRHFRDDSYVFQDDNAPVHRARIVERYEHDNNIHGMVWSAQSPDINVIENCWLRIKRTLQYRAGGITNSGQSGSCLTPFLTSGKILLFNMFRTCINPFQDEF